MPYSVPEMQAFFKEAYLPSIQRKVPASGLLFNLPILSQLGFVLPRYIPLEGISVSWSDGVYKLRELRNHLTESPPMILLVSGSDDEDQNFTFGLFNPTGYSDEEQTACAFQLEPVHRIFRVSPGNPGNCSIQLESEGEWPTLNGRLTAKEQDMELMVDITNFGSFYVRGQDGSAAVTEIFYADVVELLCCDQERVMVEDFDYRYIGLG